jgi:hypothetical protein
MAATRKDVRPADHDSNYSADYCVGRFGYYGASVGADSDTLGGDRRRR